jgi:hypothetical protein
MCAVCVRRARRVRHVAGTGIGSPGAAVLAQGLVFAKSLRTLQLSSTCAVTRLTHAFPHVNSSGYSCFRAPVFAAPYATHLLSVPDCELVTRADNGIGDEGITALARSIPDMPALETLDLSRM